VYSKNMEEKRNRESIIGVSRICTLDKMRQRKNKKKKEILFFLKSLVKR